MPQRLSSFLLAIALLLVLAAVQPSGSQGSMDWCLEDGDLLIHFTYDPNLLINDDGGLDPGIIEIRSQGGISIGLSDGTMLAEVVDPTPGSPLIPWFATTIASKTDILSIHLIERSSKGTPAPSGLMNIPNPTSHWEGSEPFVPWQGDRIYPDNRILLEPIGYRHSNGMLVRVYSLWFTPFSLDAEGDMVIITSGTLDMEISSVMTEPTSSRVLGDASQVPGTLTVHDGIDVLPEYLIITDTSNVEPLRKLSDWRNRKGLATSVVEIDMILGNYSGSADEADLLREYIKDVRNGWGKLKYVLLAGDWTTIPVKRVKDSDPTDWDDGWIPADSYFQCLDGTWDLDGDGLFAEVGDMEDIIPDVALSRLAIDDPEIWSKKVDQIIEYEMGAGIASWSDRTVLIGANTHNEGDGGQFSDYLNDKYLSEIYGETVKLYEDQGTLSWSTVDENMRAGASFVQFVDHGGPLEWCDDYGAGIVYRDRDARSLDNSLELPFISALACLTTWFDDSSGCPYNNWENCLGEAFTENTNGGAVGYVGSSRVSVGIINADRYLPYDNGLIEDIARQIGGSGNHMLGDIHTQAKTYYAEVWGSSFTKENNPEVSLCWLEFTLLGEPAIDLWTEPGGGLVCSVEHEDDLDPHIVVAVTDEQGAPIENANVSLQNFERGVFQRTPTDIEGKAVFDLVLDWFCDINLTVTRHDMVPYTGFIRISDVIPPITELSTYPTEPDGENGWFRTKPVIRLTPNERGTVHYRIGMGPQEELDPKMNFTLPELEDGDNQIHFFSEDKAGNLEIEQHISIKIDTIDPTFTYAVNPPEPDGINGWYTTEPMISVSGDNIYPGSQETGYFDMDGMTSTYSSPFYIPEGEHSISLVVKDESGRSSNTTDLHFKVDITSPTTQLDLDPPEPDGSNGWYVTTPKAEFFPSEPGSLVEYRTSPRNGFTEVQGELLLDDGEYWLEYRSTDLSGNMEATKKVHLRIDTRHPSISYRLTPPLPDGSNEWYVTIPELSFQWTDRSSATIFANIDGEGWNEWKGSKEVAEGEHQIEAKVVDLAGLESDTIVLNLKVDTIIPETILTIRGAKEGDWYTSIPSISLEGGEGARTFFKWSESDDDYIEYTGLFYPFIEEGILELVYQSIDQAGNEEDERTAIIKIDRVEPKPGLSWSLTDSGTITMDSSSSRDGSVLYYRFLVDGKILKDWSEDPLFTAELKPGSHTITVEVMDSAGNLASRSSVVEVRGPPYLWMISGTIMVIILVSAIIYLLFRRKGQQIDYTKTDQRDLQWNGSGSNGPDHRIVLTAEEIEK